MPRAVLLMTRLLLLVVTSTAMTMMVVVMMSCALRFIPERIRQLDILIVFSTNQRVFTARH